MSRILLDTNALIWTLTDPDRIPLPVQAAITDPANELLFSAVSVWEIAIKTSLGRVTFKHDPRSILIEAVAAGLAELPVTSETAIRVAHLPWIHRDPFDRLIIAQAMAAPARLLTADRSLSAYSELVDAFDPVQLRA